MNSLNHPNEQLKYTKFTIFQKYMVIRLNEIKFRKQLKNSFNSLKKQSKSQQSIKSTDVEQLREEKFYTVQLEIIRPKLRGEIIFEKVIDVSKLRVPKTKQIKLQKEICSKLQCREELEREKLNEIQNIKQLILFQKDSLKELRISKQSIPHEKQIRPYLLILYFMIFYVIYLILTNTDLRYY
ncbi:hypothetical protein pb186bvf_007954 [Paramecium bursaria]